MLRASGIHSHARLEAGCEVGKLCLQASQTRLGLGAGTSQPGTAVSCHVTQLGVLDFAHDLQQKSILSHPCATWSAPILHNIQSLSAQPLQ